MDAKTAKIRSNAEAEGALLEESKKGQANKKAKRDKKAEKGGD